MFVVKGLRWSLLGIQEICSYPSKLGWIAILLVASLLIWLAQVAFAQTQVRAEDIIRKQDCQFACSSPYDEITIYRDDSAMGGYRMMWTSESALDRYFTTDIGELSEFAYSENQLTAAWTLEEHDMLSRFVPVGSVMRLEILGILRDEGREHPREYLRGRTSQEILTFILQEILPRKQNVADWSTELVAMEE